MARHARDDGRTPGRGAAGSGRRVPVALMAGVAVACLVLGALFGRFVLAGLGGSGAVSGVTSLEEGELDTVVATYAYDGRTVEVTARDVIEANTSLETAEAEDGTYAMPSADDVLAYARNEILNEVVADEGIEVSDEEVDAFAESMLGTSDYAQIAAQWGLDEESARRVVGESAAVYKLREQVVGDDEAGDPPAQPAACAEGEEDVATAEYGAYVVGLLGDEWDAEGETWARTDGPYYELMGDMEFSSTSATYNQAATAYYVAYAQYSEESGTSSQAWTDYVNTMLSTAEIDIYSLVA